MKLHTLKTILIALMAISLFACKKDASPASVSLAGFVKTQTVVDGGIPYLNEYFYDNKGRLEYLKAENSLLIQKFDYSNNKTIKYNVTNYTNNNLVNFGELYLNINNLIDSSLLYHFFTDSSSEKYYYINNKLSKLSQYKISNNVAYLYNTITYQYDVNSNVIQENNFFNLNLSTSTIKYTYSNYANTLNFGVLDPKQKNPFLPIKKEIFDNNYNLTKTEEHNYFFDNNNRLIKDSINIYFPSSSNKKIFIYTYY